MVVISKAFSLSLGSLLVIVLLLRVQGLGFRFRVLGLVFARLLDVAIFSVEGMKGLLGCCRFGWGFQVFMALGLWG